MHAELGGTLVAETSLSRFLPQIGALILTLGAAGLLMGYAGSEQPAGTLAIGETIEAGEFVLRDADGVACAWLKVDGNNSPILMLKKGTAHATLRVADGAAGLACGTKDGVTWNGVTSRGPNVNFRGKNLKNGAWLGVGNDLAVGLHLYGETLKVGVKLRVEPDGSPVLQLADRFGKQLLTLPNPSSGTSMPAPVDSDLESVLQAWPTLSPEIRKAILALIDSCSTP